MPHEVTKVGIVEDRGELRYSNAALAGTDAHCELVAEVPGERFAHARYSHGLPQQRGHFEVELIERHDAVKPVLASQVADSVQDLSRSEALRHGEEFGDAGARPAGVLELVDGEENYVHAETRHLFHKELALLVGANAENRR